MPTANRVYETSTTTGTGSLTLAGAKSSDFITFNTSRGTNRRFAYKIDNESGLWETGVAYLSASTTLVRDFVTGNSSGTLAKISFTGTLQVSLDPLHEGSVAPSFGFTTLSSAKKWIHSASAIRMTSTKGMTANRIWYIPFLLLRPVLVDTIGIQITAGNGSSPPTNVLHLGLYDVDPNTGEAGHKLVSVTDLDPSAAAAVTGTFTEMELQPGWYYTAAWSDATPTVRANEASITMRSGFGALNAIDNSIPYLQISSQTSLSDLPAVGDADTAVGLNAWGIIFLGHS